MAPEQSLSLFGEVLILAAIVFLVCWVVWAHLNTKDCNKEIAESSRRNDQQNESLSNRIEQTDRILSKRIEDSNRRIDESNKT